MAKRQTFTAFRWDKSEMTWRSRKIFWKLDSAIRWVRAGRYGGQVWDNLNDEEAFYRDKDGIEHRDGSRFAHCDNDD
jgi:hypothetical protein